MSRLIPEFDDIHDAERTRIEDALYTASKFGLNFIPVAGPFLSELMGYMFANPIENRRTSFFQDLNDKLTALLEAGILTKDDLKNNEDLVNVIINAVPMALRSFEEEKRHAFRNSIVNTARRTNPDDTKTQIFLRNLESMTLAHIQILYFINDPRKWFKVNNKAEPNLYMGSLHSALKNAYPELVAYEDLIDIIWSDLQSAGFHRSGGLKTMMTGSGILDSRTTALGAEFIKFITYDDLI